MVNQNSRQIKMIPDENIESKIALLKQAIHDKDFLADLQEVNEDFKYVDGEMINWPLETEDKNSQSYQ